MGEGKRDTERERDRERQGDRGRDRDKNGYQEVLSEGER